MAWHGLGALVAVGGIGVSVLLAAGFRTVPVRATDVVGPPARKAPEPLTVAELRAQRAELKAEFVVRLDEYRPLLLAWQSLKKEEKILRAQPESNTGALVKISRAIEDRRLDFEIARGRYQAMRQRVHDLDKMIIDARKAEAHPSIENDRSR